MSEKEQQTVPEEHHKNGTEELPGAKESETVDAFAQIKKDMMELMKTLLVE